MIRILVGFYGMVIAVACYIRYIMHIGTGIENGQSIWSKISKRVQVDRKPPKKMLPKNMIIAMAQRKIYQVQNYVDGPKTKVQKKSQKERWAKKMISNSSKKLDAYEPNAFELGKIVDKICDHIDKTVVESKVCQVIFIRLKNYCKDDGCFKLSSKHFYLYSFM